MGTLEQAKRKFNSLWEFRHCSNNNRIYLAELLHHIRFMQMYRNILSELDNKLEY